MPRLSLKWQAFTPTRQVLIWKINSLPCELLILYWQCWRNGTDTSAKLGSIAKLTCSFPEYADPQYVVCSANFHSSGNRSSSLTRSTFIRENRSQAEYMPFMTRELCCVILDINREFSAVKSLKIRNYYAFNLRGKLRIKSQDCFASFPFGVVNSN